MTIEDPGYPGDDMTPRERELSASLARLDAEQVALQQQLAGWKREAMTLRNRAELAEAQVAALTRQLQEAKRG